MPIGRLHHVILDCPDPLALATFYSRVLGLPISYRDDDFAVVSASDRASGLAFQRSPDLRPATWPDPAVPQQIHLDVMVDDMPAAYAEVLALGATKLAGGDVFADPAGHPSVASVASILDLWRLDHPCMPVSRGATSPRSTQGS